MLRLSEVTASLQTVGVHHALARVVGKLEHDIAQDQHPISGNGMEATRRGQERWWELYIELLTRITTQPLPPEHGVEKTALDSVFSLFPLTREIIKRHGRASAEFTKLAIIVLNQVVRPFTARWHRCSEQGAFADPAQCETFRQELAALQIQLSRYTQMLGEMAGVEDDWTKLAADPKA